MRKYRFPSPEEKKIGKLEIEQAQNIVETLELVNTLNEQQKLEQAQSNAEIVELIMMLGGM